jgi:uncharacterized protein with PQ loop repeat
MLLAGVHVEPLPPGKLGVLRPKRKLSRRISMDMHPYPIVQLTSKENLVMSPASEVKDTAFHRIVVAAQILAIVWSIFTLFMSISKDISRQGPWSLSDVAEVVGILLLIFGTIGVAILYPFAMTLQVIKEDKRYGASRISMYLSLISNCGYIAFAVYTLINRMGGERQDSLELCTIQCAIAAILGILYVAQLKVEPRT